jgi:zona occludens toxin (predicted ATPase)
MHCASFDLKFLKGDELMIELSETKFDSIIVCDHCHAGFSKEYIEENLKMFTDPSMRAVIIERKLAASDRYRKLDEENADIPRRIKKSKVRPEMPLVGF